MFKFVVVLGFVAAAVADPEPGSLLLSSPYIQPYSAYSTVVSPGSTSISSSSSSVIHPSPLTYASPYGFSHFIKKRSADPQFLAYNTPLNYYQTSYQYPSTVYSTPTLYSAPLGSLQVGAHLIKKRSAQFLTTPYITPTSYISSPYIQSPYYGSQLPLFNNHFIKKRSAEAKPEAAAEPQLFSTDYLTPTFSTPYWTSPAVVSNYYSAAQTIPLATTHFIKKRSAEAAAEAKPEAAAEPAADPQYLLYPGSSLYSGYPATRFINSASLYNANPFVYSSWIKK